MARTLDENKICFITAVRDRAKYQESMAYWQRLKVPDGMTVQYITISDWPSIGQAYQMAMGKSDAKYKIYIHDNIWLTRPDFLEVLIQEFREHPEYGIASVAGSINLPEGCYWWEKDAKGCICDNHQGEMKQYVFRQEGDGIIPALMLHDGIMMTQYDISWQTEFYDKGHLYAASQCMEFRKHGYGAAILPQLGAGVQHWGGKLIKNLAYAEAGKKLVREYRDVFLQSQPLVSVIVPVYNGEKFFQPCIESILVQTYKNMEIILVDDASTDSSWEMLNRLYKDNPRVVLLHHDVNQGAGLARNTGIEVANGKYIAFVDSDDFADEDYIETLVVLAEAYQADVAACSARCIELDGNIGIRCNNSGITYGGMPAVQLYTQWRLDMSMWGKIISRRLISEYKLKFSAGGFEDTIFCLRAFYYTNLYVGISDMKYCYKIREESLSHAGDTDHCSYIRSFCTILFQVENIIQELKRTTLVTKEQEKTIYRFFLHGAIFIPIKCLSNMGKKQRKSWRGNYGLPSAALLYILKAF